MKPPGDRSSAVKGRGRRIERMFMEGIGLDADADVLRVRRSGFSSGDLRSLTCEVYERLQKTTPAPITTAPPTEKDT